MWQQLSSKELFRNRWLWLTEDEVLMANGQQANYVVVHKQPFALIVPWDGERFTIVGQYRYQPNSYSWEFPQGHFEHNSIEETARRELKEETGITAQEIRPLGTFLIAPGAIDQTCHAYVATGITHGDHEREATEDGMKIKHVTLEELKKMIRDGEIKDGVSITALYLFMNMYMLKR